MKNNQLSYFQNVSWIKKEEKTNIKKRTFSKKSNQSHLNTKQLDFFNKINL